jgi:hypothetical protein
MMSAIDVGHQLGGDRVARLRLLFFSRVTVVRDDRRDAARRCAPQRIENDEQLDQVLRDRLTGRLHEKDVVAPDALADLDVVLAIGEAGDAHRRHGLAERLANLVSELRVGVAGQEAQLTRVSWGCFAQLRTRFRDSLADPGLRYFFPTSDLCLARRRVV